MTKQTKTSLFQIVDNEALILMSKIFPPNLKTAQLKQIYSITLVSNLLLYFIGTTIDVFTSYTFFYKNIFYKNIEAEICEILGIF